MAETIINVCQDCKGEYRISVKSNSKLCPSCRRRRSSEKAKKTNLCSVGGKAKAKKTEGKKPIPKAEKPKRNICDKYCDGCIYKGKVHGERCCNYLLVTDKMRCCPAGTGCTAKVTREMLKATKVKKPPVVTVPGSFGRIAICPYCGVEFKTTKANKKYCSPECARLARLDAWSERNKKRKEKANGKK